MVEVPAACTLEPPLTPAAAEARCAEADVACFHCGEANPVFLERSPWEVNRCPLEPVQRPDGCPKREDTDPCLRC